MLLSAPRKLECCPPLLSRSPGPISCGQVLIVNFVLFECLPAELFRRHGKPPVARRAAREAGLRECGARVVSRTAQASEPSESEDDEDKARFVRPFRLCSDFASKAARRERQTNLDHRRLWPVPAGAGRAAAKGSSGEGGGSSQNRKQMCSANTAAKAHKSTPALGRIWPQPDDYKKSPSISWKRHSRRLTPCRRCGYENFKTATPKRPRRPSRSSTTPSRSSTTPKRN